VGIHDSKKPHSINGANGRDELVAGPPKDRIRVLGDDDGECCHRCGLVQGTATVARDVTV
jgi:hypothetical protein